MDRPNSSLSDTDRSGGSQPGCYRRMTISDAGRESRILRLLSPIEGLRCSIRMTTHQAVEA